MKTIREQTDARRRTKLEGIRRQVKTGKLVVRQMTSAERDQFPASAPQRAEGGHQ